MTSHSLIADGVRESLLIDYTYTIVKSIKQWELLQNNFFEKFNYSIKQYKTILFLGK